MRRNRKSELWKYLDTLGVLDNGNESAIKDAKRRYRKQYFQNYKRKQRALKPEFIVPLSKSNGEYSRVVTAAKRHNISPTAFLKQATMAYLSQTFLVPDRLQVAQLELLLSECLNEIRSIVKQKERFFWDLDQKYTRIEKRIEKLEGDIDRVFRNPPLTHDNKNKIT